MTQAKREREAARAFGLLWRAEGTVVAGARGPKQGLTVDRVVDAAIVLADTQGLEAVSIRRVADALGVAPMSMYTYVTNKNDLLDLMLDTVNARMARSTPKDSSWEARVTAVAIDNRALHEAHPWVVALPPNRPPLGPGTIGKYEHELAAFEGTSLTDIDRDAALTWVLGFVEGTAQAAARARASRSRTGETDAEWWEVHGPLVDRFVDAERFPLAMRVGSAAGEAHQTSFDPEHTFVFGLARVIDGLAALVATSRAAEAGRKTNIAATQKPARAKKKSSR